MDKKKILEKFPILRKIRTKQIKFVFYAKMYLDKNKYCKEIIKEKLPYQLSKFKDRMVNTKTGYPIEYQYNKVFNLKLASKKINKILIKPNETFSFYMSVKGADKKEKYKKGLTLVNGKIEFVEGGGMCQISNLLFQVFLNSPLTIVERHTHKIKDFPEPMEDALKGIDATLAEGFLDLKVRNDTQNSAKLMLGFTSKQSRTIVPKDQIISKYYMRILADDKPGVLEKIAATLSHNNISISAFLQKPSHTHKECAKILLSTHITYEYAIQNALSQIQALEVVRTKPAIIRIEDEI